MMTLLSHGYTLYFIFLPFHLDFAYVSAPILITEVLLFMVASFNVFYINTCYI